MVCTFKHFVAMCNTTFELRAVLNSEMTLYQIIAINDFLGRLILKHYLIFHFYFIRHTEIKHCAVALFTLGIYIYIFEDPIWLYLKLYLNNIKHSAICPTQCEQVIASKNHFEIWRSAYKEMTCMLSNENIPEINMYSFLIYMISNYINMLNAEVPAHWYY